MARDTSQQGLISHTAVLNRLVQVGFEVLLPWADHLGYDLAYYVVEEYRSFGFFVHQEAHLVRIQVKTGRIAKDGTCFEFNTVSVTTNTKGSNHRKRGYVGKAEYFGVYVPDNGKVYIVAVNEAPQSGSMTLRFKNAGVIRGNHKKTYTVPYEEINEPRFHWAEDYEQIPLFNFTSSPPVPVTLRGALTVAVGATNFTLGNFNLDDVPGSTLSE